MHDVIAVPGAVVGVLSGYAAAAVLFVLVPQPGSLLAAALVAGVVGGLVGRWVAPRPLLVVAAVVTGAASVAVLHALWGTRDAWIAAAVCTVVLLAATIPVAFLARRGARAAAVVVGVVGGLLAVDLAVTALLAWWVRGGPVAGPPVWLWFPDSVDNSRHYLAQVPASGDPSPFDIADTLHLLPYGLTACAAFAVCCVALGRTEATKRQLNAN
jgi:hypothetical protein